MAIIYQKYILRNDLRANPDILYIFGDNDARRGFGGQAKACRGEPNSVGVRVKKFPATIDTSYLNDIQYDQNCQNISDDLKKASSHLERGGIIVLPLDGIGTGLAQMAQRCPKTFKFLNDSLKNLVDIR